MTFFYHVAADLLNTKFQSAKFCIIFAIPPQNSRSLRPYWNVKCHVLIYALPDDSRGGEVTARPEEKFQHVHGDMQALGGG